MSFFTLTEQSATPATPTAGKVRFFFNTSSNLCSVDDAGTVTVYGAGLTQEQVEDYVGALLQDSSTVDVTYNDAGNAVTFAVIAGGVNHNALLNYVANQHVDHSTVSISAGTGLTGGGDITTSRTISMPNVGTAGTYRSVTTDAQGRVTAGTNPTTLAGYGITDAQPLDTDLTAVAALAGTGLVTRTAAGAMTTRTITAGTGISLSNGDGVSGNPTISSTITQYTDEDAQDAVGGILTDSASVDFTYNDGANTITAAVLPAGVDHDALQNFVANEHVDHSAVTITAGTGLSGGGDLTTSRTLDIANTGVTAGTYGSAAVYPVITVNEQGQITAASTQSVPGGALYARTTSALGNSSNVTYVNLSELAVTLDANTIYVVRYLLIGRSAVNTTGLTFSLGGGTIVPASTVGYWQTSTNATAVTRLNFVNNTTNSQFAAVAAATTDQLVDGEVIVVTDAGGGTLIPQFRSENNGVTVTIQANSFVTAEVLT